MAGEPASSAIAPPRRDEGGNTSAASATPEAASSSPQASAAPGAPGVAAGETTAAEAAAAAEEVVPSLLLPAELAEAMEHPDLAAMRSLMEETPEEEVTWLREQGNIALKEGQEQGRKGQRRQQRQAYLKAVDLYSQAITTRQQHPDADIPGSVAAMLHGNRAQAHLLLGNYGRALADATESARLDATNAKAPFRAAKACVALQRYAEAMAWCDTALALPSVAPADLLKLKADAQSKLAAQQAVAARSTAIRSKAERLARCMRECGVRMGRAAYKELSGERKVWVDEAGTLHWPVVLVYPEAMASDLIEDVCHTDSLGAHVREMFGPHAPPLEWDREQAYSADSVQLFLRTSAVPPLPGNALVRALLEDAAGLTDEDSHAMAGGADDEGDDAPDWSASGEQQWVRVPLNEPLARVLTLPNHVVPGVPVFHVVSTKSPFYFTFTSGQWVPP
ncbi:hypothetical protein CLOM_g16249 [Closterium sp. NIES-68]|nr:hypothetical protein CLOM_g16249 [Closterium sp. NIES-68]GJP67460.1 hypothetical protein CLOP_g24280 [Closterium sp. NIES-67]